MKYVILISIYFITAMLSCNNGKVAGNVTAEGFKNGMVVSAHPEASEIGINILKKGGNAVDAAVATGFALAVCLPSAGNIGGGGFMVLRLADGTYTTLDYREKAPQTAHRDMFLDKNGNVKHNESLYSHAASGVPGSVDGLLKAHEKYGKLSLKELIRPSIDLAENGFKITRAQARELNNNKIEFLKLNSSKPAFVKNEEWKEGDLLIQKDLAETLKLISDKGRAGFYEGITAQRIVDEMKRGNGLITAEDLKNYSSVWRNPVVGNYKDYKIISMGLPSSGGIVLLQLLKMTEPFDLKKYGFHGFEAIHIITEAERRAYADRAEFMGDADFVKVPVKKLTDSLYLKQRMSDFDANKAGVSENINHGNINPEKEYTTHYSIIDRWNNCVSVTTTINDSYGSRITVKNAGFILNNEMDDFSIKPGVPNYYGLLGNKANAIEPGKRMLSAMTPTIVEKNGKPFMIVGTPGGSTIITGVFQAIINVTEFGMNMQEAVNAKRFHHQWKPDIIRYEKDRFTPETEQKLKNAGHKIEVRGPMNRIDAILIKPDGSFEGGADPRGDDCIRAF